MKKIGVVAILILIFLILYFFQANFFSFFTIAGIKPNLFIIFTLIIGLHAGRTLGMTLGIIFGLILDFVGSKYIGITSVMLGIAGFLGGYFDKTFSKDSRITVILMIVGSTILCESIYYFWNILKTQNEIEYLNFIKIVLIETIYNILLTIIIYPLIQKFGYRLEENFKEKKVLTKYF